MERRHFLWAAGTTLGLGLGMSGSALASDSEEDTESRSGVVVGVHDDDLSPTKEVFYDVDEIPPSHLDGFARQDLDVLAVTDVSDLDCDWMMTLHLCPRDKNGQRLNNEWGVEKQLEHGVLQKEEGHRLLGVHDKPRSIELTDVGVRVSYDKP